MESFEIIINNENFKIIRNKPEGKTFSVFNYATCHIIKKNDLGEWKTVEHRFGADNLPLNDIGDAIDRHYNTLLVNSYRSS